MCVDQAPVQTGGKHRQNKTHQRDSKGSQSSRVQALWDTSAPAIAPQSVISNLSGGLKQYLRGTANFSLAAQAYLETVHTKLIRLVDTSIKLRTHK